MVNNTTSSIPDANVSTVDSALFGSANKSWNAWQIHSNLLDLLPTAVYFCDVEGHLLHWNQRAVALWGREPLAGNSADRYCGAPKLFRIDGNPLPHCECPMAVALATGEPQTDKEAVIERADGSRRIVMATVEPIKDETGSIIGAVNVLNDITEKKQTEQFVFQLERRFRLLLEKLPAAAYTCDSEGLITFYNERAVELWGRAPKLNDSVDRFCGSFRLFTTDRTPIKHDQCWMALALRNHSEYVGEEIVVERPDATQRTVLAYATPFCEDSDIVSGAVNVLVDITERQETQSRIQLLLAKEKRHSEQLREADRRKDEFLAMLAHELRNPLAPIRSGLDILAIEENGQLETIKLMQEQVVHLVRLVDDLLDVSRIMQSKIELKIEPVELAALVKKSAMVVQNSFANLQQEFVMTLPKEPIWLNADPIRLMQVFENLLHNASKYTPAKGKIELSAECRDARATIRIQDNGIGMEQDLLPHVFELFTQSSRALDRAQGGLGIGLTLVQRLVNLHGGTVSAFSDGLGLGSIFVTELPVIDAPTQTKDDVKSRFAAVSRRVVIVDDNRGARWLLSKLLTKLGRHEIILAEDGPTALATIREFRPDIVLLDIGLPGMDGFEVGQRLREDPEFDDVLLVALTGYGREEDRQASELAGFDEHLVKPPSVEQIEFVLSHPKLK